MNILVTSPSLNPSDNVSGISSIVRLLMQYNRDVKYFPFVLGRRDNDKRGLSWLVIQIKTPFKLISFINQNSISAAHFNVAFEPFSLLRDILPFLILVWKKKPLCLHIHGGRYMASVPFNWIYKLLVRTFLKYTSEIVVLSDHEMAFLKNNYPFVNDEVIHVLPNVVELPEEREIQKNFEGVINLLYLGRIDRKKGLEVIAKSLNILSDRKIIFQFNLCGVGPDKEWFLSLLNDVARDSVIDRGLVYGDTKKDVLELSHIFLLPSFYEGLPVALLESMANAIVPIVTPVGSMPDVVINSENGYLVSDCMSIVDAVSELNNNRQFMETMAHQSREIIKERFSITKFIDQINAIYARF